MIHNEYHAHGRVDGLVQDCSDSSVFAIEFLQPCTKPSVLHSAQQIATSAHLVHRFMSYELVFKSSYNE